MGNPHKPGHSETPGIRPVEPGKGSGYVLDVSYLPTSELLRRCQLALSETMEHRDELWDLVIDMRRALEDIATMARKSNEPSIAFIAVNTLDRTKGDKND